MAECGLDETAATSALESANWDLRVAIVMQRTRAARDAAENALRQANFSISKAVDLLKRSERIS
jgi:N-acetylmuramic acid 6-phosphate (MurNAc-6-P) etherase